MACLKKSAGAKKCYSYLFGAIQKALNIHNVEHYFVTIQHVQASSENEFVASIGGGLMRLVVGQIMCIMPNRDMSNPKHKHKQLSLPDNKSRNTLYVCFNVEIITVLYLHCGRR